MIRLSFKEYAILCFLLHESNFDNFYTPKTLRKRLGLSKDYVHNLVDFYEEQGWVSLDGPGEPRTIYIRVFPTKLIDII